MKFKPKKKLTLTIQNKVNNRYYSIIEKYKGKTLEELRIIAESKMSRTDRLAIANLMMKTNEKLLQEININNNGDSERE